VLDGRCDGHREWPKRNAGARDVFWKRRREVTEAESSNEFVLDASRQRRSAVRGGRDVGTEKSAAELRCWMDAAMGTANVRKEAQERVTYFGSDDRKSRKLGAVTCLFWTRRGSVDRQSGVGEMLGRRSRLPSCGVGWTLRWAPRLAGKKRKSA
jgi:hypothetical protein